MEPEDESREIGANSDPPSDSGSGPDSGPDSRSDSRGGDAKTEVSRNVRFANPGIEDSRRFVSRSPFDDAVRVWPSPVV